MRAQWFCTQYSSGQQMYCRESINWLEGESVSRVTGADPKGITPSCVPLSVRPLSILPDPSHPLPVKQSLLQG